MKYKIVQSATGFPLNYPEWFEYMIWQVHFTMFWHFSSLSAAWNSLCKAQMPWAEKAFLVPSCFPDNNMETALFWASIYQNRILPT